MVKAEAGPGLSHVQISDWRVNDQETMKPILQAALDAITEVGFHGTTIRKIAQKAGLSVPGVYHHYESKHALLVGIMEFAMDDLWVRTQMAIDEADGSVEQEFEAFVECMVLFHASRPALASAALTEIRSLDEVARAAHIERRDRQHRVLDDILRKGLIEEVFRTSYPFQASTAIITMCTGVAQWFNPKGELTPEVLAARYQDLAVKMVA